MKNKKDFRTLLKEVEAKKKRKEELLTKIRGEVEKREKKGSQS